MAVRRGESRGEEMGRKEIRQRGGAHHGGRVSLGGGAGRERSQPRVKPSVFLKFSSPYIHQHYNTVEILGHSKVSLNLNFVPLNTSRGTLKCATFTRVPKSY